MQVASVQSSPSNIRSEENADVALICLADEASFFFTGSSSNQDDDTNDGAIAIDQPLQV